MLIQLIRGKAVIVSDQTVLKSIVSATEKEEVVEKLVIAQIARILKSPAHTKKNQLDRPRKELNYNEF